MEVKTNKTKFESGYRLTLTTKETREYVMPRFKHISGKFKLILWPGKNGLRLHFKKYCDGTVKVGFEERGFGVTETYYTMDELETLMLPF